MVKEAAEFFKDLRTGSKGEVETSNKGGRERKEEKGFLEEECIRKEGREKEGMSLIMKEEVQKALETVKKGKAARPDGMENEVLRIMANALAPFMANCRFVQSSLAPKQ